MFFFLLFFCFSFFFTRVLLSSFLMFFFLLCLCSSFFFTHILLSSSLVFFFLLRSRSYSSQARRGPCINYIPCYGHQRERQHEANANTSDNASAKPTRMPAITPARSKSKCQR